MNYTVGGTASNGTDYTTIPTSVVIPAGSASATITVTPIDDTVSESNETVVVTLSSSASYNVGSQSAATVTIADNDVASAASIALSFNGQIRDRVGGGETALSADGQMDGTFTVTLSAGSGNRTVTGLDLARAGQGSWDTQPDNGSWVLGAASTLDAALFNAANGTVNFPLTAGSSFNIFASDFQGAMFVAGSSFTLTASFADGSTATAEASIGAGALPTVTVAATDANAAEAATPNTGIFTVSRTGSTAAALTVNYTVGGTATNGTDYTTIPTSVVIPAGSASATITVTPIDDTASEGNETVVVTLSSSASYTVGSPSAATVTIADNDVAPAASIALSFNGQIRDRVGGGETALSADGQMDGTFTVTLSAGSGNRTVTRLDLARAVTKVTGIPSLTMVFGYWVRRAP